MAAQRKCSTPVLSNDYETWIETVVAKENKFAKTSKTTTIYNIPVIVHIIHPGSAVGVGQNISQAQVNSQIDVLNKDYRKLNTDFSTWVTQSSFISAAADCEINFCLATHDPSNNIMPEPGIDRISTAAKGWTTPPYNGALEPGGYIDNTIKPGSVWDPTKYLNIWVLYMNDGTLGYAQFPSVPTGISPITDLGGGSFPSSTDGVVINYDCFGTTGAATAPYNLGRTTTHELGHWLGLRHINGDSSCGEDFCADTPKQNSLSSTCPSTPGSVVAAGCGAASPSPPGKMYQNFMDYSDDKCCVMFTANQKARIQACMANCVNRLSLNTSDVCGPVGLNEFNRAVKMNIYPNPTQGEFTIEINFLVKTNFSICITNAIGQTIKELNGKDSNGIEDKINLTQQPSGLYFITLKSEQNTITKKIILQ